MSSESPEFEGAWTAAAKASNRRPGFRLHGVAPFLALQPIGTSPMHPLQAQLDPGCNTLTDLAMSSRCGSDSAYETDGLLHFAGVSSRRRAQLAPPQALAGFDVFDASGVPHIAHAISTGVDNAKLAVKQSSDGAPQTSTKVDNCQGPSTRQTTAKANQSSDSARPANGTPSTASSSDSPSSDAKGARVTKGSDDTLVVEMSPDGGGVVINSANVTIQCDNNFSFSVAGDGSGVALTPQQNGSLAKKFETLQGTTTQVNVVKPPPQPPTLAQRIRGLAKRPTKAQAIQGAQIVAVVALAPHLLRWCRSAWVRRRTRRALDSGDHELMLRLLASDSPLVRCAVVQSIADESHKSNAGQLWRDGAFTAIPDHELARSVPANPSLPKNASMPAFPKQHSALRLATVSTDTNCIMDLDSVPLVTSAEISDGSVFTRVVASEGVAKASTDGVLTTVLAEIRRMLASDNLRHRALACSCIQKLAFTGDRMTQKLVAEGFVPELVSLMRDRNGTRTRGFATLRQHDVSGPRINFVEVLRRSPLYMPQVNINTTAKIVSIIPRGINWLLMPGAFLLPQRLDQRNGVKRLVRQQAAEALQNLCAVRSACKRVLECDGLAVIVDMMWTGDMIGQLAAVETLYSIVSHYPNCRNLVYSLAGDYALSSVSYRHDSPVVHAACTKTLVKLRPDRGLLPSDSNMSLLYR